MMHVVLGGPAVFLIPPGIILFASLPLSPRRILQSIPINTGQMRKTQSLATAIFPITRFRKCLVLFFPCGSSSWLPKFTVDDTITPAQNPRRLRAQDDRTKGLTSGWGHNETCRV
ncbi:uncharacterized protein N7482_007079 [Penicillium canariense]|uniref:Uncharacterized protein n=1 Tax=Penicillium canariense TaxID=189055 RepID=A0A9W9I132_9EURO|nr:uncharacterized protein N7482_007079 [Penicillium canariense]KAJ5160075.1 hypothetical protein N7482_007079 [Penicillium canariense]